MPACEWSEDSNNPIYNPPTQAYYQTVRYSGDGFAPYGPFAYYKMWYDYASAGGIALALSPDGINWTFQANMAGLVPAARHSLVLFDAAGFGIGAQYRIWYWDSTFLFYTNMTDLPMLRTAESTDGINWTNDTMLSQNPAAPLLQPLPALNRGSYGAMDLLYFAANPAVLDLANPFNNRYVMYYDITTGGPTQIALAVSVDGITWSKVGPLAVIPWGGPGAWDENYAASRGRVLQLAPNNFIAWYSGGIARSSEGIGCATSADGINWTKSPVNPVFSINDGVLWRNSRTYNAWALYDPLRFSGHGDPVCYKLWLSGSPTTNPSDLNIGYATNLTPCDDSDECLLLASDPDTRMNLGLDTPNGPNNPIPDYACHDICVQEVTMIGSMEIHRSISYPPGGQCRLGGNQLPSLVPNQQCSLFVTCVDEALGADCASIINTIGLIIVCTCETDAVVALPVTLSITFNKFCDFPRCVPLYFSQIRAKMKEIDGSCKVIQLKATVNADGSVILVDGKIVGKLWKRENLWFEGLRPYELNQAERDEGFISFTVDSVFNDHDHMLGVCHTE